MCFCIFYLPHLNNLVAFLNGRAQNLLLIMLKRIRDHDDILKEQLEAKRMKLEAVFAEVIESRKKKLMGSVTMKEGAVSAIDV